MIEDDAYRKVVTYKCLNSLLFQARFFFKLANKKRFTVNSHHIRICEVMEKVLRGELTRVIINIAPRYSKTELCVKQFIAHGMALSPESKFIHLSYSDTLALDNSEDTKDILSMAEYQVLFPHVQIKHGSNSKKKWDTTAGGGVYATSTGGQITGFGAGDFDPELDEELANLEASYQVDDRHNILVKYKFRGAIIIDDAIKSDDADSKLVRERINTRYHSTIENRTNGARTPIIIIMQRQHPDDLCGHLLSLDGQEWTVVSIPCIIEEPGCEPRALWPAKHSLEKLYQMQKDDPVTFGRQYMQRPMPREGLLFPADDLQYYDHDKIDWSKVEYTVFIGDPADTGGDMFAGPIAKLIGNKLYITDAICTQNGKEFSEEYCTDLIASNHCDAAEIEGVSAWKFVAADIRDKVMELLPDCNFRIVKQNANKETRIIAHSVWVIKNCIFDRNIKKNKHYAKFMEVLCNYLVDAGGKKQLDDPPDAMSALAAHMKKYFPHLWLYRKT
ncbi:hypothetical protein L0F63_006395 [Massospora cicadina]|nr:hypothetical protein L0F63_006395 [Massospora cicadina]